MASTPSLEADARSLQIFHFTLVSTVALLFYDYALTLREEVRFMWTRQVTLGKLLFFLTRYVPFITAVLSTYSSVLALRPDSITCRNYHIMVSSLTYINFILALAVLFTRTYAVWRSEKAIFWILSLTYVTKIFVGVTSYILSLYIRGASPIELSRYPIIAFERGCVMNYGNDLVWIDCVIMTVSEALAVGLLIVKSVSSSNYSYSHTTMDLLNIMVRDGVGYFICNIGITLANVFVLKRSSTLLRDFMLISQGILESVLCGRLLLHVFVAHDAHARRTLNAEETLTELRILQVPASRPTIMHGCTRSEKAIL